LDKKIIPPSQTSPLVISFIRQLLLDTCEESYEVFWYWACLS